MFSRFQDYRVLESIAQCYRILQSITECYRVLQSVTECYRVLESITEYYRVLQTISSASTWTNFWACFIMDMVANMQGVIGQKVSVNIS